MHRNGVHRPPAVTLPKEGQHFSWNEQAFSEVAKRVLRFPTVASKSFLITIGDRSVTGLVSRDQMVGPWQVPVADVGVTAASYHGFAGEAMAMGERTPLALLNPAASGRMAVCEALTNIAAAHIPSISSVKLSANWMAAAGYDGEDAALFDTVQAVGLELCPQLGIAIPVGKDSLSMRTRWTGADGAEKSVVAPLSLVVTAFAPVADVRLTLTPALVREGETVLLFIDLAKGKQRLGGSIYGQAYSQIGDDAPDLEDVAFFKAFFTALQDPRLRGLLLAYHDRSDGGLFVTLAEMAFAGHCGLDIDATSLGNLALRSLFNEELGAVVQVRAAEVDNVLQLFKSLGVPPAYIHRIARVTTSHDKINVHLGSGPNPAVLLSAPRAELQAVWAEVSYRMQLLRDNPECAQQEFDGLRDTQDPGLHSHLTFDPKELEEASFGPLVAAAGGQKPRVAILREQGVNGHVEMAMSFDKAGFESVDVHMSDILSGSLSLAGFTGLVACGGFSYGDVLGAGEGWAKSILFNPVAREEFSGFFRRADTFTLGVCNGCQMLSNLKELIPGTAHWPRLVRNRSEQFEARVCMVEVTRPQGERMQQSLFFEGMEGSRFPVAVAHGEGRTEGGGEAGEGSCLRFVDNYGKPTEVYPRNPNGSRGGG